MTGHERTARRLLVGFGLVTLCVGLTFMVVPTADETIGWPWSSDALVAAFFTVTFVLAMAIWNVQLIGEGHRPAPPERVPSTPVPGRGLERTLRVRWSVAVVRSARRREVWRRLRRATLWTIVRTENCARETARDQLDRGTWTEDATAAAFLAAGPPEDVTSIRTAATAVLFPWRARRTAAALLAVREDETA